MGCGEESVDDSGDFSPRYGNLLSSTALSTVCHRFNNEKVAGAEDNV